jgi:RNA recognition motif-containing protein
VIGSDASVGGSRSGPNATMIGRKRPRDSSNNNDDDEPPAGKLFLGGIHSDASESDMKAYCAQFGPMDSFFLVKDTSTGNHKG